jgi:hypothetical protein
MLIFVSIRFRGRKLISRLKPDRSFRFGTWSDKRKNAAAVITAGLLFRRKKAAESG